MAARRQTPQGHALAPLVRRFNLPRHAFDALVDGVAMDVGSQALRDLRGPVPVLHPGRVRGRPDVRRDLRLFRSAARQYATDLGVALQLTNILRDVPEDLARGRVYIPQEDLRRFGCSEEDLRRETATAGEGVRSAAVRSLLQHQAVRARDYYARAAASLPAADARRLAAAEIMGAIYFAILKRIEAADYDVFSRVIRIPRPRRALDRPENVGERSLAGV